MKPHTLKPILFILVALSLAALACGGGAAATDTPAPKPTQAPQPTATTAPKPTEVPTVKLGDVQKVDEGGFSFRVVPGYDVSGLSGFYAMGPKDADPSAGPGFIIVGGPNENNVSLDEAFEQMTKSAAGEADISNKQEMEVDGQPGLLADLEGQREGADVKGRIAIAIYEDTQAFALIGYASPDQWDEEVGAYFDAVLESVQLFDAIAPEPQTETVRQWAASATASSAYGDPSWAAMQATGAPDVEGCADNGNAWAAATRTEVDWLEVQYATPVLPTEINIYQSYSPSQVVLVEAMDAAGQLHEVYRAEPENLFDSCPYMLNIPVTADYQAVGLKITVDHTILNTSWNEIDAVELVGQVEAGAGADGATTSSDDVTLLNSHLYEDHWGYIHIVGALQNTSDEPLTAIELELTLTDASGASLLTSGGESVDSVTFSPFLYTLEPGQTSPFDYYLLPDGDPEAFTVAVTDSSAGQVERGELKAENVVLATDDDGDLFLTGEIVNQSDEPVKINSFAGAALDGQANVMAADYSSSLTRYLAPAGAASGADRTPFVVSLDGPADEVEQWALYWDADVTDELSVDLDVAISGGYLDDYGSFHLVGTVTNNTNDLLTVALVGGLYADDNTVVDAATGSIPVYVEPGASVPFDLSFWNRMSSDRDLFDQVDTYVVQIDPYWTYETSFEAVTLVSDNEEADESGDNVWAFTGEVINNSGEDLSSAYILVAIYDSDDNLVGMNWTSVYPTGDVIQPNDTLPFELTVYLDPDLDDDFTFVTLVQGYLK